MSNAQCTRQKNNRSDRSDTLNSKLQEVTNQIAKVRAENARLDDLEQELAAMTVAEKHALRPASGQYGYRVKREDGD